MKSLEMDRSMVLQSHESVCSTNTIGVTFFFPFFWFFLFFSSSFGILKSLCWISCDLMSDVIIIPCKDRRSFENVSSG